MLDLLDVLMLFVTSAICWLGIFSKTFTDNLFQRLGMGILGIACLGRGYVVIQYGLGNELYVWVHAGTFLFAVGTWWKFSLRVWWINHPFHAYMPYGRRKDDQHVPF